MANDLNKLTIVEGMPRMKAMALTDNVPLITAWSNDTSYENAFSEQLLNFIQPGDIVICISASGNSPNILRAIEVARQSEATVIGFTGQPGGKLRELADHSIFIPDDHIGRQEDGHMILDHVISNSLRHLIMHVKHPGGSK
jgi:D-sedoheptulose 7-phosphate isomerase